METWRLEIFGLIKTIDSTYVGSAQRLNANIHLWASLLNGIDENLNFFSTARRFLRTQAFRQHVSKQISRSVDCM